MTTTIVAALIGCTGANFIYRAATDRDWVRAFEWSVAQATLVIAIALASFF